MFFRRAFAESECAVLHLIVEPHVFFAAHHRLVDDPSVERHHQGVLELHAIAPDMGDHIGDVDDVLAVRWEIGGPENASARAERKARHMSELRAGARAERPPAGSRIRPAHRFHSHGARGDDILLDE